MSEGPYDPGFLPLYRSEALTDGIFAVAMTLLVIDLKVPDHALVHSADDLTAALAALLPKVFAWGLSFFVLALFWIGHHRMFAFVHRADSRLVTLNLFELAAVTLMPFSTALSGEYGNLLMAQAIYSANMAALGFAGLLLLRHIRRHPELGRAPMPLGHYQGARLRIVGLIVISVAAVVIAAIVKVAAIGNMAFMLMIVITPYSRRIERRGVAAAVEPAPS